MITAKKDPAQQVESYIEQLPQWSKTICKKLRELILNADTSIEEDWKWGPHYKSNGMVCGFGAFQKHVKFTFFNGSAMKDRNGLFNHCTDNEFSRSIKYTDIKEIKETELTSYIKESVALNKKGFKRELKNKTIEAPEELKNALSDHKKANRFFDSLSYGYRKEFIEYVQNAKQAKTRAARIGKVVVCCSEGKRLNDKYHT